MRAVGGIVLASALLIGRGAGPGLAATFQIDPAQSALVLQLFRDGAAAKLAHDHVVHASRFSGTVAYDPRDPTASSIRVEVEVGSLVADDPGRRRAFKLDGELSASDRAAIDKAMKAEGQLAADRFASITFASTAVTVQTDSQYWVTGRLTIRGVTNELGFRAGIVVEGTRLRGRAQLKFKQSSFGYRPYSALLGAIKNKDEVILHVDLVAKAP